MGKDRFRDRATVFLKGFAIGAAEAVPGVSGGTIALITGIYQRLISALSSFSPEIFSAIFEDLKGLETANTAEKLHSWDVPFLLILGLGMIVALFTGLQVMGYMLSNFLPTTYGFFFGLIAISAVVLYRQIEISSFLQIVTGLAGILLAFLLSGYGATFLEDGMFVMFLAGMLAVNALVLPGISGSLVLVILGQYENVVTSFNIFFESFAQFLKSQELQQFYSSSTPVLGFISGGIVGLFIAVNIIEKALELRKDLTLVFLVSLVFGSLRAPVVQVEQHLAQKGLEWASVAPGFIFAALIGGVSILLLDHVTESKIVRL